MGRHTNQSVASTRFAPRRLASNEKPPFHAPISSTLCPVKLIGPRNASNSACITCGDFPPETVVPSEKVKECHQSDGRKPGRLKTSDGDPRESAFCSTAATKRAGSSLISICGL